MVLTSGSALPGMTAHGQSRCCPNRRSAEKERKRGGASKRSAEIKGRIADIKGGDAGMNGGSVEEVWLEEEEEGKERKKRKRKRKCAR
eukprot:2501562-Rhodomonas_salina.2